jgi:putative two-component system response regulator
MNPLPSKQTILIVDDVLVNIKLLTGTLKSEYAICTATNGLDALEIVSSDNPPDLILLDVMMPDMDGYEVCKRIKKNRYTQNIPVIFITARDEESHETKGFEVGAVDYIKKPFNREIVKQRVKTHISLKNAREALENQKNILKEKVKERTRELEETQVEVVERLGLAAEFRDETTGNHLNRMSEYCRLLAKASDYTAEEYDTFALSSTLHDVGKIGIPDNILLKPGKLTKDEWEIMKSHASIGAKLLAGSKSKFLNLAESIALTHHEKWNGTGYPHGVKGEKIPLEGRITCICDVFDALISKRPYKEAWPVEKAMDEISNSAGTHFDSGLVRLFLELEPALKMTIKELN